jgi:hypothetical protein
MEKKSVAGGDVKDWAVHDCAIGIHPNPFVDEVRVEAMAEGNAGNRSAGLDTLNDPGL